jgi:hypothetical protein
VAFDPYEPFIVGLFAIGSGLLLGTCGPPSPRLQRPDATTPRP